MPTYRLVVAYDGTDFCGWQKQHPPNQQPLRTVQGELEEMVRSVVREPIRLLGASRTDSGVHALGQCAVFTTDSAIPMERLFLAINGRLPDDIVVRRIDPAPPEFDPISDALEKEYRYAIAHRLAHGAVRPLFDRRFVAHSAYALDPARMARAAQDLVGEHDFASFTRLHHGKETTVRTVTACAVTEDGPDRIAIRVRGTGFLHNMVRIMAGTLMEVGRGAREPDSIPAALAAADRREAGATAPPEGLRLEWVRYEGWSTESGCGPHDRTT